MSLYRLHPQFPMNFGELIVDSFAGSGGASTGIELAMGRPVDIAINHDPEAIALHTVNHPHTRHYCESVWDVDPREVTQGRPVGYIIDRLADGTRLSKDAQGRMCGNSVCPELAAALIKANMVERIEREAA